MTEVQRRPVADPSGDPADRSGERRRDGYVLSTDPARVDVDVVHRWLAEQAYWALGRPRDVVVRTIASSRVWSVFAPSGEQVAFGRAVTDGLTFGWLCDVFVDPAHRGRGLATWLSAEAVDDLKAVGVDRLVLATSSAHAVYRRVGFTVPREGRYMEIDLRPGTATA
jgi:GNAT superfamily N-acetyltransferase